MMLLLLLKSKLLKAKRGDVIIFNNTSAEHPATYDFTRKFKEIAENEYGIPFFWIEFQSVDSNRGGYWHKSRAYRLVNTRPYSAQNPNGYHSKGEVFEEFLSLTGFVPNQFTRLCTQVLKIAITKQFIRDWFSGEDGLSFVGSKGKSKVSNDSLYENYLKNRGSMPKEEFLKKKAYLFTRPSYRPEQKFKDFSCYHGPFKAGKEYVSFVGFRADEARRVERLNLRKSCDMIFWDGEHCYVPLHQWGISKINVQNFWQKQDFDLALDYSGNRSNCVFCFMKGAKKLRSVLEINSALPAKHRNTPMDVEWWMTMEEKYGKKFRESSEQDGFVGFFGNKGGRGYAKLKANHQSLPCSEESLPCSCTD